MVTRPQISPSEAARVLGKLGGEARGRALPGERRKAIASQGASARWARVVESGRSKTDVARAMGRRGGAARRDALSAARREEIARNAARAMWKRRRGEVA